LLAWITPPDTLLAQRNPAIAGRQMASDGFADRQQCLHLPVLADRHQVFMAGSPLWKQGLA
jgi:hypothetical protein